LKSSLQNYLTTGQPIATAAALLIFLTLLVFAPTLRNGFVYDDHHIVERNPVVRTLNPATHLTTDFWSRKDTAFAYYRPVVTWSLALDRAIYGATPWGFHLTNLVAHVSSVLLLFLILRRFADPLVAWLGAAIFAVHPIQTESVAWIVGRTDLLACLFVLLATWIHLRIPDRPGTRDLRLVAAASAAGFAALLCKEIAVVFPVAAFAADLARRRLAGDGWAAALRHTGGRLLRIGPYYALSLAAYAGLRLGITGQLVSPGSPPSPESLNPLFEVSTGARLLTAVNVAGRYLGLVIFPLTLSVDYLYDVVPVVQSVASVAFFTPLLAVCAAVALSAWLATRRPAALFGTLVALCAYLPMSHLLFTFPLVMAERYFYVPMVGISALAAAALLLLVERFAPAEDRRKAVLICTLAVVALLGGRSLIRTLDWKSDFTLFSAAVRATPRSVIAWSKFGHTLASRGEYAPAVDAYDRALEIYPHLGARRNRIAALRRLGRLEEAERSVRSLVDDKPQDSGAALELIEVLSARAAELESQGEIDRVAALREEAVRTGLSMADEGAEDSAGIRALFFKGAADNLIGLGRPDEAEQALLRAVEQIELEVSEGGAVPEASQGLYALILAAVAEFYRAQSLWTQAAQHFELTAEAAEAAGQESVVSRMRYNAAEAWRKAGELERAGESFRRVEDEAGTQGEFASEARSGQTRVLLDRAEQALARGRPDEALLHYDSFLAGDPESQRARHGRARARLQLGDAAGAEDDLRWVLAQEPTGIAAAATWTDLAIVATLKKDWREAELRLDSALEHQPNYPEALYRRGLVRIELEQADGAEDDLMAALDAGLPGVVAADVWYRLAQLAADNGKNGVARERLSRCLEIRPDHPEALALSEEL
jgi:tetratricopeptide (TPR) repeat protein